MHITIWYAPRKRWYADSTKEKWTSLENKIKQDNKQYTKTQGKHIISCILGIKLMKSLEITTSLK